jgi:GST-like protein
MSAENYVPPKAWSFEKRNGGTFASINGPAASATHDKPLPGGRPPILADGVAEA